MSHDGAGKDFEAEAARERIASPDASIVAITGAGISVASGLPTLRDRMRGRRLAELFRSDMAERHVHEYMQFYDRLRETWGGAAPNMAHIALARRGVRIITQNMDGLHQRAGSAEVVELHGSLARVRCSGCRSVVAVRSRSAGSPLCRCCGALVWPDVVLEGQPVHGYLQAFAYVSAADVVIVAGTRLAMSPVRELPRLARKNGVPVLVVNHEAERRLPALLEADSTSVTLDLP
jgi:NAD-dependent deacetylase